MRESSTRRVRGKIVAFLGASPTQYADLLEIEKKVERRAAEDRRKFFSNLSFGVTCAFCLIMSAFVSIMPLLISRDISAFAFALLGITMSMLMVGLWTLPNFDTLLSPTNYLVIARMPVSSRTYFLVKLTQLLTYAVMLLASLNLLPAICGVWLRGSEGSYHRFLFPVVYLLVSFTAGFFMIGVMTAFAGYFTKLYTKKGLQRVAQYAQFILPALFPASIYLVPTDPEVYTSVLKWTYLFPNGWFAGVISLVFGGTGRPEIVRDLILTGVAFVSVCLLIVIPLRSIATGYSKYLTYLLESGNRQRSRFRVKPSLLARLSGSRTIYAGFCLSVAYMRRDKYILHGLFSGIGGIAMLLILVAQGRFPLEYSYATGMSPVFTTCFSLCGISVVGTFLTRVKYSEHWKASWMLSLAPLEAADQLWRGVLLASFLYLVVPYTLLLFGIASIFWGGMALFYVLPGLILLLYYVVLFPKPHSGLLLSLEVLRQSRTVDWVSFIAGLIASGVLLGLQFLAYQLSVEVYVTVYCVIVIGGFIGFIFLFRRSGKSDN